MVYMGSKNRIAKYILPFLQEHLNGENYFVDAFCGGCNLIDKLDYPKRIANDSNEYLIALFKALQDGWIPKEYYTKEEYTDIRLNKDKYPMHEVGYVGFVCSFRGKWYGGYAQNNCVRKNGRVEHHQSEQRSNILRQFQSEQRSNIRFTNKSYEQIVAPQSSVIYCDPPYANTTGYKDKFNHEKFWQWCRDKAMEGHKVFISEYNAPNDFVCIWEKEVTNSLSTKNTYKPIEKLFTFNI